MDNMTLEKNTSYEVVSADLLKSYIARIERLEEEKTNIQTDIKEIYSEAKSGGFDVKVLKKVVSILKRQREDREKMAEEESLLETYLEAIGVL